jgi:simple sugar transport system permease protein
MLAATGGAFLSIGHLTLFTRNMSNGRGWIAITAALFGFNHPIGVLVTGMFFGFADALAIRLQTTTKLSPSLVQFLPHVFTLLAIILVAVRSRAAERLARRAFRLRAQREIAAQAAASAD